MASGQRYGRGTAAHLSGPTSWFWPPEATCSTWNQPIMWAPNVLKRKPKNSPSPPPPSINPIIRHDMKAAKVSYELKTKAETTFTLASPRHDRPFNAWGFQCNTKQYILSEKWAQYTAQGAIQLQTSFPSVLQNISTIYLNISCNFFFKKTFLQNKKGQDEMQNLKMARVICINR